MIRPSFPLRRGRARVGLPADADADRVPVRGAAPPPPGRRPRAPPRARPGGTGRPPPLLVPPPAPAGGRTDEIPRTESLKKSPPVSPVPPGCRWWRDGRMPPRGVLREVSHLVERGGATFLSSTVHRSHQWWPVGWVGRWLTVSPGGLPDWDRYPTAQDAAETSPRSGHSRNGTARIGTERACNGTVMGLWRVGLKWEERPLVVSFFFAPIFVQRLHTPCNPTLGWGPLGFLRKGSRRSPVCACSLPPPSSSPGADGGAAGGAGRGGAVPRLPPPPPPPPAPRSAGLRPPRPCQRPPHCIWKKIRHRRSSISIDR